MIPYVSFGPSFWLGLLIQEWSWGVKLSLFGAAGEKGKVRQSPQIL